MDEPLSTNIHNNHSHIFRHSEAVRKQEAQRRSLTFSYLNRELEDLRDKEKTSKDLEMYERIYLTSGWRSLSKSKHERGNDRLNIPSPDGDPHTLAMGRSNLEMFDSISHLNGTKRDTKSLMKKRNVERSEAGKGREDRGDGLLGYLGRYKLVSVNPKVNSPEAEFDFFEYHRKLTHYRNLEYLNSLLDK